MRQWLQSEFWLFSLSSARLSELRRRDGPRPRSWLQGFPVKRERSTGRSAVEPGWIARCRIR